MIYAFCRALYRTSFVQYKKALSICSKNDTNTIPKRFVNLKNVNENNLFRVCKKWPLGIMIKKFCINVNIIYQRNYDRHFLL